MSREQNPDIGKVIYAKKNETVYYFISPYSTSKENGLYATEGNKVGVYNRTDINRTSGELFYAIAWPSDNKNPLRYVLKSQVEFTSFKSELATNENGTIPNTSNNGLVNNNEPFFDPASSPENKIPYQKDNSIIYLAIVLIGIVGYKIAIKNK